MPQLHRNTEFVVLEYKQKHGLTIGDTDELLKRVKDDRFNLKELRTNSTRTLQEWAQIEFHWQAHDDANAGDPYSAAGLP